MAVSLSQSYYLLNNLKRIRNDDPYISLNKEEYSLLFGGLFNS